MNRFSKDFIFEALYNQNIELKFNPEMHAYRKLDKGLAHHERRIPENIINFVVNGSIVGTIGKKRVSVQPGDFIWISPNVIHSLKYTDNLVFYFMRFQLMCNGKRIESENDVVFLQNVYELQYSIQHLIQELSTNLHHRSKRLNVLFLLLLSEIIRLTYQERNDGKRLLTNIQQSHLIHYVHDNLPFHPSPLEMAEEINLSPQYFSRIFKNTFGVSPRKWLVQERMRAAAIRLLDTDKNITEVAYDLGYDDIYFFSRQFKEIFGMSPRAYRKKNIPS